ncbi:effector-binding domain-containing protein [Flavobacteriaceae bacterium MAR_2010_105]|nr:effector-binding domain-containing protein [Flavobacteriaceae bacterium MAR_2010_105]
MKAFKYLLFLLLILIIGLSIYVAVQPNSFEVTRERTIEAPEAVIYNQLIDFKNWEAWSPWIEKNPGTKVTYPEQTKGVGGSYAWEDDDGVGNIKTINANPNSSIEQEMQFDDFAPSNISWNLESAEEGITKVTWKISGKDLPFMFKAYSAFSGGFDAMMGPDFERGLEKLDSLVVTNMKVYDITINGITEHGGGFYIYNTASCKMDDFEETMKTMLPKVGAYATANNITMAGPPFISYHKWDEKNNAVIFSSCVPTTSRVITTDSDILTGQIEPFRAIKTTLKGNYTNLKEAWEKTMAYIPQQGLEFAETGPMLEVYVTDPMNYPNPADWVTEIYIAIKD